MNVHFLNIKDVNKKSVVRSSIDGGEALPNCRSSEMETMILELGRIRHVNTQFRWTWALSIKGLCKLDLF